MGAGSDVSAEVLRPSAGHAQTGPGNRRSSWPDRSSREHDGEFGTGEEWQLLLKTQQSRYAELETHLLKHHPWRNPEIAAVPIVAGSEACLRWLTTHTTPAD